MSTKSMLRRHLLVGSAALLASAALAAPAMSQGGLLELTLAVADPNVNPVTDSVLKLAETLGYYEQHGLRLTIIPLEGTPQAVAALNAGHVDLADISIDAVLRLRAENDVALRGVVSATLGPPYLIAAKTEITDVAGLAGRSFAIADNGSLDHNLTQHVLAGYGVARDAPQFVTIGPPAVRVRALAAGQVDATTVSYGTYLPIAETPGLHIIVQPAEFFEAAPVQSKFVAVLESTIETKREAVQAFVDALVHLARDFDSDPAKWVDAMVAARPDLTRENLEATTGFLAGRWCINGCINVPYIQETTDFIYETPDFAGLRVIPAADVTDESFILKSIETLGAYEGGGIDAR
ncbi:MAG: ABC transporter substrate-binding protein [Bauldia sp.]|nr:ABC transporter substrate-binding protein [Bauldia sp.]